jgi:hypothetical protein
MKDWKKRSAQDRRNGVAQDYDVIIRFQKAIITLSPTLPPASNSIHRSPRFWIRRIDLASCSTTNTDRDAYFPGFPGTPLPATSSELFPIANHNSYQTIAFFLLLDELIFPESQ